jgi:hypothetical protein
VRTTHRFTIDEASRIIDALNSANSGMAYSHEDGRQDDRHLREQILMVRLGDIVDKLIINYRPLKEGSTGREYQPSNEESQSILLAAFNAIRASHVNYLEPLISLEHQFNGKLNRQKKRIQHVTSLALFVDDVECILRDLYGDVESQAMGDILHAVLRIVEEFTRFVRTDLWKEHQDAVKADYIMGIGVPDGRGINGSEWREGLCAQRDIEVRIAEVRANPSAFSEYTVAFVNSLGEPGERQGGRETGPD